MRASPTGWGDRRWAQWGAMECRAPVEVVGSHQRLHCRVDRECLRMRALQLGGATSRRLLDVLDVQSRPAALPSANPASSAAAEKGSRPRGASYAWAVGRLGKIGLEEHKKHVNRATPDMRDASATAVLAVTGRLALPASRPWRSAAACNVLYVQHLWSVVLATDLIDVA